MMKDDKDAIVDFIDDEEYYEMRRNKQQIENATWAIYIFGVIASISYVFYLLLHTETFDWVNLVLNIAIIAIYFCLAAYSNQKPFTAFIALFCVFGFAFLLEIMASQFNLRGIIIKIVLVVYISTRLEAAKKVQDYEKKNAVKV
jgi:cell shape-determining protein MreD